MKRSKDKLINDKTLPIHNFITLELVRRKIVTDDSDFELYLYDALFEELLLRYEFKTVIVCTNYVISRMKQNKFLDEHGNPIENIYAYFASSVRFNLKKITSEFSWEEDNTFNP